MDSELQAIKDAWENRPAAGEASQDPATAEHDKSVYEMADEYVDAHAADFAGLDSLDEKVIVMALEKAREDGDEATEWKYQTWLFHKFEPQQIGGTYHATVRMP